MPIQPIIIDTDPGIDDALALFFALNSPELNALLITTCSGNNTLDCTTNNTLHLLDLFKKNIPVSRGADRPLKWKPVYAIDVQGVHGFGSYVYDAKKIKHKPIGAPAADAIYQTLTKNLPAKTTLLCIAPLTNIAHLLQKYPKAKDMIDKIVFMGGLKDNIHGRPYKEFNINYDPAAADVVFKSGIDLVMLPRELGRFTFFDKTDIANIKQCGKIGAVFAEMFDDTYFSAQDDNLGATTQDLCAAFYLVHPEYIKTEKAKISIKYYKKSNNEEIAYVLVDYGSSHPNALVGVDTNVAKFKQIFFTLLKKEG